MIMKHLEAAVEKVREMGYTPIYAALYGSQNYGLDVYTDNYQSDYDVKVVVMPTLHDLVFKESSVSMTIEYDGGQIDIKDVISMTRTICKSNVQYIEILLTPFFLVYPGGEYMESLRALTPRFLEENAHSFAKATYGHFKEKIAKAQKISPSSEERIKTYGYDGKQLCHALRLKLILEDFEKTFNYILHPPSDYTNLLLRLKRNEVPCEEAMSLAQLWSTEIVDCANRIIATPVVKRERDAATEMMDETKRALYLALRSEAMGVETIKDAKEGSKNEQ